MRACCIAGAGACQRSSKASSGIIGMARTIVIFGLAGAARAGTGALIPASRMDTAPAISAHHRAAAAMPSRIGN